MRERGVVSKEFQREETNVHRWGQIIDYKHTYERYSRCLLYLKYWVTKEMITVKLRLHFQHPGFISHRYHCRTLYF